MVGAVWGYYWIYFAVSPLTISCSIIFCRRSRGCQLLRKVCTGKDKEHLEKIHSLIPMPSGLYIFGYTIWGPFVVSVSLYCSTLSLIVVLLGLSFTIAFQVLINGAMPSAFMIPLNSI